MTKSLQSIFPLTRRSFLAGSAALFGASALDGLDVHTLPVKNTGFPRGKERNLLAKQCSPEELRRSLIPLEHYMPYPKAGDPEWGSLRPETRAAFVSEGEKFLGHTFEALSATLFLSYARVGNRSNYERGRTANLAALQALTYAECVESKGRFLDDIANGLWCICEQSFWGVPAHLYIQKAGLGLPDPQDPIVDLFAAQTAAELATVVYQLSGPLNSVSPFITERVYLETERRIFKPLLAQNFMWMGLPNAKRRDDLPWDATPKGEVQPVNNWDSWICWNWLNTALMLDRDAERRTAAVEKMMVCLDNFINTYPDDGGCEEGCSYWNEAPGTMLEGLELLGSATNGRVNIWDGPLLKRMGEYIVKVRIAGDWYINSGDAHSPQHLDRDRLFRYGNHVGSPLLTAMATGDWPADYLPHTLPAIFGEKALRAAPRQTSPLLKDVWLPQTAVMAARMEENSAEGLYLACIASDNGKSHSHNDTGSFWVYLDGEPVLIDLGAESYQKQSFDEHRYELASTQSAYHNLPTIGEVQQGVGSAYRATDLRYLANSGVASLEMNLAEAYPAEANLQSWIRGVALDRTKGQINIRDRFALKGDATTITWSLMTCREVKVEAGKLRFVPGAKDKSVTVTVEYDPALMTANVETIRLVNAGLIATWGPVVYRVQLKTRQPMTNGESRLKVSAG
jgi:hypothetical protein